MKKNENKKTNIIYSIGILIITFLWINPLINSYYATETLIYTVIVILIFSPFLNEKNRKISLSKSFSFIGTIIILLLSNVFYINNIENGQVFDLTNLIASLFAVVATLTNNGIIIEGNQRINVKRPRSTIQWIELVISIGLILIFSVELLKLLGIVDTSNLNKLNSITKLTPVLLIFGLSIKAFEMYYKSEVYCENTENEKIHQKQLEINSMKEELYYANKKNKQLELCVRLEKEKQKKIKEENKKKIEELEITFKRSQEENTLKLENINIELVNLRIKENDLELKVSAYKTALNLYKKKK